MQPEYVVYVGMTSCANFKNTWCARRSIDVAPTSCPLFAIFEGSMRRSNRSLLIKSSLSIWMMVRNSTIPSSPRGFASRECASRRSSPRMENGELAFDSVDLLRHFIMVHFQGILRRSTISIAMLLLSLLSDTATRFASSIESLKFSYQCFFFLGNRLYGSIGIASSRIDEQGL